MTREDEGSGLDSWKEKWGSLSERGRVLTEELGSKLSEAGQQISEASSMAASQARDGLEERRQRKMVERMGKEVDELVAVSSVNPADEAEVERLRLRVATLEVRQREQEALIEEMSRLAEEIPEPDSVREDEPEPVANPPSDDRGFFATISQTYSLIGFAVLWALLLVVTAKYVEDNELMLLDYPAAPMVWIAGTMIWSFVVVTQISNAGSFPTLPLSFRIQATLGVGVATTATSLLPEISQMSAMFHIFSWLALVAITILTISAVMNGFRTLSGK